LTLIFYFTILAPIKAFRDFEIKQWRVCMRYKANETKKRPIEAPLMMRRVIFYIKNRVKVFVSWIENRLNIEIRSL